MIQVATKSALRLPAADAGMSAEEVRRQEGLKPEIFYMGDIPVVLPCPFDRLHPARQRAVERASISVADLFARKDTSAASRFALELEERLGVTTQHRIEAMRPGEAWEALADRAVWLALGSATEPPPVKPAKTRKRAASGPGSKTVVGQDRPSPQSIEAWECNRANLLSPNARIRRSAWDAMATIEREWIEGPERKWVEGANAETLALAASRGEEIDAKAKNGKVRILSRGGLDAAFRAGHLDAVARNPRDDWRSQELVSVGEIYGSALEVIQAQATPNRDAGSGMGREGPQHAILHSGEVLAILRGSLSPEQTDALDLICGLGMSINAAALSRKTHRLTMRTHLREGLGKAALNWSGKGDFKRPSREECSLVGTAYRVAQRSVR